MSQNKTRVAGSISKKIVATELQEERDNCNFDQKELFDIWMPNKKLVERVNYYENDRDTDPKLNLHHNYYQMTVEEKQMEWYKKLNHLYFRSPESKQKYFVE